jgi:ribose 5-phosphate isomerase B
MIKIHIASDHAGYEMKNFLKYSLIDMGYEITDHGPREYNAKDDYPDFIIPCAEAVAKDPRSVGIILGGSGEGEQIAANKVDDIRALEYYGKNLDAIIFGRQHNNANILSLGARFMTNEEALEAVNTFLNTPFSNEERHIHRLEKVRKYDEKK